jgi:hypothetical protein
MFVLLLIILLLLGLRVGLLIWLLVSSLLFCLLSAFGRTSEGLGAVAAVAAAPLLELEAAAESAGRGAGPPAWAPEKTQSMKGPKRSLLTACSCRRGH